MKTIILPDGQLFSIRFESDSVFGSLHPIKVGGQKEYYCRECFAETQSKPNSLIPLKTPHWTQSLYPDGVVSNDARIMTRLCDAHAALYLTAHISDEMCDMYQQDCMFLARMLLLQREQIKTQDIASILERLLKNEA